jgi:hypothetical protein
MTLHSYSRISAILILAVSMSLIAAAVFPVFANTEAVMPVNVNFSGILTGTDGKPLTTVTIVTFSVYRDQTGGEALWTETANVQPDSTGRYSVVLGSTKIQGLPANLFVTGGEARWLGVRTKGQTERPRIMMLTVPYAVPGPCSVPPDPGGTFSL